jgi:hypothetical protein
MHGVAETFNARVTSAALCAGCFAVTEVSGPNEAYGVSSSVLAQHADVTDLLPLCLLLCCAGVVRSPRLRDLRGLSSV